MRRIVALLGDYYHPLDRIRNALNKAIRVLEEREPIEWVVIEPSQLINELEKRPDAVILFKENRVNPTDDKVETWMTDDMAEVIANYVDQGGGWLSWHSGLASYPLKRTYFQMVKGSFEYHPEPHFQVKYTDTQGEHVFGPFSFEIKDEHYYVTVKESETNLFLQSDSEDGHSVAGWYHHYGNGRVCCFTPAHNEEGLLNGEFTKLLAKTIDWVSEK